MKSATFLNYVYGIGILLGLYFLLNEILSFRLRFHSLDAVIPALEHKLTGPSVPTFHPLPAEKRNTSPHLVDAVSSWIRDDAYPTIKGIDQPYDSEDLPMPTVTEVGWWGGDQF
jgi:hypothetical protein